MDECLLELAILIIEIKNLEHDEDYVMHKLKLILESEL